MNNKINLLQSNKNIQLKPQNKRQKKLRLIAVSLLFAVSVSAIIFFILVSFSPLPQLRKEEKIASLNLSYHHDTIAKLALIKDRVDSIDKLLENRTKYNETLTTIQSNLPIGTAIDSVNINKDSFSAAISSDSLKKFEIFLDSISRKYGSDKKYSNIKVENITTPTKDKNFFLLTVKINI